MIRGFQITIRMEEVAIVWADCRFLGEDNLEEFWEVLINGENHVKEISATRWTNSAFYDEDHTTPGKIYVNKAGILKGTVPLPWADDMPINVHMLPTTVCTTTAIFQLHVSHGHTYMVLQMNEDTLLEVIQRVLAFSQKVK